LDFAYTYKVAHSFSGHVNAPNSNALCKVRGKNIIVLTMCFQFYAAEWLSAGAVGSECNSAERKVSRSCRTVGRKHSQCVVKGTH